MQSHSQMNAWCILCHSEIQAPARTGGTAGGTWGEGRGCTRSVLLSSPKSQALSEALKKTHTGSKAPVPASLLLIPPSGGCHLARTIIHSHTKWPMEEKLVLLKEQMTSGKLLMSYNNRRHQ